MPARDFVALHFIEYAIYIVLNTQSPFDGEPPERPSCAKERLSTQIPGNNSVLPMAPAAMLWEGVGPHGEVPGALGGEN